MCKHESGFTTRIFGPHSGSHHFVNNSSGCLIITPTFPRSSVLISHLCGGEHLMVPEDFRIYTWICRSSRTGTGVHMFRLILSVQLNFQQERNQKKFSLGLDEDIWIRLNRFRDHLTGRSYSVRCVSGKRDFALVFLRVQFLTHYFSHCVPAWRNCVNF